jgi:glucose-specific phosphotransferase system IIBC component
MSTATAETANKPSIGSRVFAQLQKVGKALQVPVAILPAAGLLLGIGAGLQQPTLTDNVPFLETTVMVDLATVMQAAGDIVFANLAVIFAIGVAIGLTNDAGVAALAAVVGFLIFNVTLGLAAGVTPENVADSTANALVLGIPTLQTGVFGGLIIGGVAAWAYNRFFKIQLPPFLGFFAGKRFVPIMTAVTSFLVGLAAAVVWPPIGDAINWFAETVVGYNSIVAAFVFGLIERSLIPFGLHHVFYPIFWYEFGTYTSAAGELVRGDQTIWFAELSDGVDQTNGLYPDFQAGTFMTGKYPFMMFGLPAAALAMYHTVPDRNKKIAGGILASAALTSFLTGITEPLEFSFLFVAPLLFAVHAVFAGVSFMVMEWLNIHIGLTFSGGLIDFTLFGLLPGRQPWWWLVAFGLVLMPIYYFMFRWAILKWDFATPGREPAAAKDAGGGGAAGAGAAAATATAAAPVDDDLPDTEAGKLVRSFGGRGNIKELNACITRLRIEVNDPSKVDKDALKALGAAGVIQVGNNMQAIFGPRAEGLKDDMQDLM